MTTVHPALAAFMAARADRSPRPVASAGRAACAALTAALDGALSALAAENRGGLAVVAVGGYGRREQCRHSDIDVMLLVRGGGERAASRLLYPVWDTGMKVGHSIRTVTQTVEAAKQNVETLTALLDARFVAGERALYEEFERALRRLARGQSARMRRELAERYRALAAREPWQPQAANLKTARGGLRTLQSVTWLAAAEALGAGREPPPQPPALEDARERLLASRNAVHALTERPTDLYRDDLVPRVAEWLGVESDAWSHDLYLAMRAVDAAAREAFPTEQHDGAARGARWRLPWRRAAAAAEAPASPAAREARERDLERLLEALRSFGAAVPPPPLEPLPRTDWLERALPEWEVLRARRHIAPFHTHPVDVHSVRTVAEMLHAIEVDDDGSGTPQVAAQLGDRDELLLSALLHDIGKGHEASHVEGGAVIAERFASRVGLPPEQALRLVRSVELHLLLPTVATRRDIADERVIRETADRVGDADTLRLLYLLTIADARATGPAVWNAWKAQLLRSLFTRTLDVLSADSSDAATAPDVRLRRAVAALAPQFGPAEVEDHVQQLEPSYLLSTPPEQIGRHIEMVRSAAASPARTAARRDPLGRIDRLTIVTPDRPGILQAVAGTLAAHNASVLGGVAYTRTDGTAIQVWHVQDALGHGIDDRRWERILAAVPEALAGTFPIDERVGEVRRIYGTAVASAPRSIEIPTLVHIDNTVSDQYSVIEVSTADRVGLLYAITRALHDTAIDIHLAKVDTIGPEVVDAFYVRRENGRRIENADEIERLERRVVEAIRALDGAPTGG